MIEAARTAKGSPADAFLQDLFDDGKVGMLADVLVRFERLARTGSLQVPLQLNSLGKGIFEIKTPDVRLPFYYADHPGCPAVRLTNGFIKRSQKCPPRYIRWATRVRGEDETL